MIRILRFAINNGWKHPWTQKEFKIEEVVVHGGGDKDVIFSWDGHLWGLNDFALDPTFWQALGEGLGWKVDGDCSNWEHSNKSVHCPECQYGDEWNMKWHEFIDYLTEGKSVESFFDELIPYTK